VKKKSFWLILATLICMGFAQNPAQQSTGIAIPLRPSRAQLEATSMKCSAELHECLRELTANHRFSQVVQIDHDFETDENYPLLDTEMAKKHYSIVLARFNGSIAVSDTDIGTGEDISLLTLNLFSVEAYLNNPSEPTNSPSGWRMPNGIVLARNQIAVLSKGGTKNITLPGGRQVLVSQRPDVMLEPGRRVILVLSFVKDQPLALLATGGNSLYFLSQYGRDEWLLTVNPAWTQGEGFHIFRDCPEVASYIADETNWGTYLSTFIKHINSK